MTPTLRPMTTRGSHDPLIDSGSVFDKVTGATWVRTHALALGASVIVVITGMAFSFFLNPIFFHSSAWSIPGDLWNTYRAAQYVVWGGEGRIYNNPAAFQTFPGIAFILAPVAKVAGLLHLSESFGVTLPQPTTWWILGPFQLALGATLFFPLDLLAAQLGASSRRRIFLLATEGVIIWLSVALWGHPEDALSLTFALYGLLAARERRWLRVGILLGVAIAVQPLVLLIVPIVVGLLPLKRWFVVGFVMVVPSALLLVAPLVQEWGPTTRILTKQPNFIALNHPTPWVYVAPVLSPPHRLVVHSLKHHLVHGVHRATEISTVVRTLPVVAAGPGRIVAIILACLIGVYVSRYRPAWPRILWCTSLALALRCLFEPIMVPYYLLPGLALALVLASVRSPRVFLGAIIAALVCTWLSYYHLSPWAYYVLFSLPLLVTLALSWPLRGKENPGTDAALVSVT